jgi:hypothetical protein
MALLVWVSSDPLSGRTRAGQDVKNMRFSEQVQAPRRCVKLGSDDWVHPDSDGAEVTRAKKGECTLIL